MDKYLYWNVRGACGRGLLRNLRLICQGPKPSVVILTETKTDELSKFKGFGRLGYDSIKMIPSSGRSRGLVLAWDSTCITVTVMEENSQFFHLKCQSDAVPMFFLTAIYGLPYSNYHEILWENIWRLSMGIAEPWSVLGDFNDIFSASERVGAAMVTTVV